MLVMHGVPVRAEELADLARGDAVLDPEVADRLVGMRQREVSVRFGMREAGRVEVEAVLLPSAQLTQFAEMFRAQFVAIDFAPVGLRIHRVQIQAMFPRQQAIHLVEIAAQVIGVRALPG